MTLSAGAGTSSGAGVAGGAFASAAGTGIASRNSTLSGRIRCSGAKPSAGRITVALCESMRSSASSQTRKIAKLNKTKMSNQARINELQEKVKEQQTDKDGKLILLYASDKESQHSYIQAARDKGYEVLLMDSPIVAHLMQKLETSKENLSFARVDADHLDKLIQNEDTQISKLSDVTTKELFQLFPKGPAKLAALVAGIPKPKGCI